MADVAEFTTALERVAAGGTALDPEVVTQLLGAQGAVSGLESLTGREREVLGLMAEGRSNTAIIAGCWQCCATSAADSAHLMSDMASREVNLNWLVLAAPSLVGGTHERHPGDHRQAWPRRP